MESKIAYIAFVKSIYGESQMAFTTYDDAYWFAEQQLKDMNVLFTKVFEEETTYEEIC